ncbi:MAG: CDP-diacylglycerol---serine O-phosphatidyltransferase [Methylobacteriaceae bacterium]|jgi:CDP-diacylglycerol--serine O-phosphatidyltransferase|nr:CDP-diacylglycerol---serine O-phosphatidyltransferase [Methylobacteriaceae bacterium]
MNGYGSDAEDEFIDGAPPAPVLRRRRFRRIPLRVVLPNLVTLLALALGLTAIRFAIEARFEMAVFAIIAAAILDGLDGRLARVLKGTSRFGAELDSLADFVDFGVAPGLILYQWSLHGIRSFGWLAAMIFAIACALRLARFNVTLDEPGRPAWQARYFVGMPAPAGACVVLLPLYLHYSVLGQPAAGEYVALEIAYVLVIAFLMASRVPHYSGKSTDRVPREYFALLLFAVALVLLMLATYPMEMLAILTLVYLCVIPLSALRYRRHLALEPAPAGTR